jgi:archaeal flagellar protein FlaI
MKLNVLQKLKPSKKPAVKKTAEEDEASKPFRIPFGFTEANRYPLYQPWAHAVIIENKKTGEVRYIVDELKLTPEETEIYAYLIDTLRWELKPSDSIQNPKEYFANEAKRIIKRYKVSLGKYSDISWYKVAYYLERDLLGFGIIDPLMRDQDIEDISCDGVNKPVYVWHRRYESIPSNVLFSTDDDLDDLVVKLAHMSGKHISTAFPILDTMLPGLHRLASTFRREVSTGGSSFTIRKFREDPITVIDLIKGKTVSDEIAAYLWMMMEHKLPTLIMGVTGSGKTTLINSLACLFRPTIKVVTIEDTPELRIPLENWVQLVSRPGYGFGSEKIGEVSLFDLIKVSLRYRPDVLVVGEVRGEEAYVLFQAIATGHGGITSIHAESSDSAIRRLISSPMNIPESYIPLVNLGVVIRRIRQEMPDGSTRVARKMTELEEIVDVGNYKRVAQWDAYTDTFKHNFNDSVLFDRISEKIGKSRQELNDELQRRKAVLNWMAVKNIRFYREVAKLVSLYYAKPQEVYENAVKTLKTPEKATKPQEIYESAIKTVKPPEKD